MPAPHRLTAAGRQRPSFTAGAGTGDRSTDARVVSSDITTALDVGAVSADPVGYAAGGVVMEQTLSVARTDFQTICGGRRVAARHPS